MGAFFDPAATRREFGLLMATYPGSTLFVTAHDDGRQAAISGLFDSEVLVGYPWCRGSAFKSGVCF